MFQEIAGTQIDHTISKERQRLPASRVPWMIDRKPNGTPAAQIAAGLVHAGFDPATVDAELYRLDRDLSLMAAERMMQRFDNLQSVLDVKYTLANLAFVGPRLERRSQMSAAEFLERYYSTNEPVILTSLLANSEARKRWTPDYLTHICGDAAIEIMAGRDGDPDYSINAESHKRKIRMADYVAMVQQGGASNDYYMVSRNHFFDHPETQRLYDEVPRFPEYLDPSKGGRRVFFWFGPAGTITPLHHDDMNILVARIYGHKRVTLIPPEQTPYIYNNTGGWADVNCDKPGFSRYPLYGHVPPFECPIASGRRALPPGWVVA